MPHGHLVHPEPRRELAAGAGHRPGMSLSAVCSFSGSRTRARAVPVAAEKVRPQLLQRSLCSPVRVAPQRTRDIAPQWMQAFNACPRASIRARTSPRASSSPSFRRSSRICPTESLSTLAHRLRNLLVSLTALFSKAHVPQMFHILGGRSTRKADTAQKITPYQLVMIASKFGRSATCPAERPRKPSPLLLDLRRQMRRHRRRLAFQPLDLH